MIFKIIAIDHDGFNGRERPPQESDLGLFVRAIKLETWIDGPSRSSEPVEADALIAVSEVALIIQQQIQDVDAGGMHDDSYLYDCWTCVTEDGRLLDLVESELELVRS